MLFGLGSAVINLTNFFVILDDNRIVRNPKLVVHLFTPEELKRYVDLSELSPLSEYTVHDTVVHDKLVQVIGYKDAKLNLHYSPAGIIKTIASLIAEKSFQFLTNPEERYNEIVEESTFVNQMCAIISYYTVTPYDVVSQLPINEIFKRYAVCQQAFPNQIQPIKNT